MACKSIVVVLCGLPCSGKSHLTNLLKEMCTLDLVPFLCNSVDGVNRLQSVIVSYDQLMPATLEKQLILSSTPAASHWKSYRQCICNAVSELVAVTTRNLASGIGLTDGVNLDTVEQVKCKILEISGITDLESSDSLFVFIIDDNMYLKSMRYEYFQVARHYKIGFCEICLKSPMDVILNRNDKRTFKIQEHIIKTMANRFEEPLPGKHRWETMAIIIEDDHMNNFQACWKEIFHLLKSTFENPIQPLEDDTELKEISRKVCLKSFIHQADNALRRQLSEIMENLKCNNIPKHEMKSNAAILNTARQHIINSIKLKPTEILQDLIDEVQSGDKSVFPKLKSFIQKEMDERLQDCAWYRTCVDRPI